MPDEIEMTLGGHELTIEPIKDLSGGGSRLDVEHADGRRWRVDVTSTGEIDEIVTTWQDGELQDLGEPDWLDDALARLARAA